MSTKKLACANLPGTHDNIRITAPLAAGRITMCGRHGRALWGVTVNEAPSMKKAWS